MALVASSSNYNQSSGVYMIKISDIRGENFLPKKNTGLYPSKFYVKLSISNKKEIKKTKPSMRGEHQWDESLFLPIDGSSVLNIKIFIYHTVWFDKHIGDLEERVDLLLCEQQPVSRRLRLTNTGAEGAIKFRIESIQTERFVEEIKIEMDRKMEKTAVIARFLDGATGAATVVGPITGALKDLLKNLGPFVELTDKFVEIHPYAKMAWGILSAAYKISQAQIQQEQKVADLIESLSAFYSFVKEAEPLKRIKSQEMTITLMVQQTAECAYFVHEYTRTNGFLKKSVKSLVSNVDASIQQYQTKIKDLQVMFNGQAIVNTEITALRILDTVEQLPSEIVLNDMRYAEGARFNPKKCCLPGTRVEMINDIIQWVNRIDGDESYSESSVLLLRGGAGTGKSAIAHSVAAYFERLGRLGSSFVFDRSREAELLPESMFSTIARDLADKDDARKKALWNSVREKSVRCTRSPEEQFEKFIIKPSEILTNIGPSVIVIDALDECRNVPNKLELLGAIRDLAGKLPPCFRILITARPEADIRSYLENSRHIRVKDMDEISPESTASDLTAYVNDRLRDLDSELSKGWPDWCSKLVEKADGLFQWAYAACSYVKGDFEQKVPLMSNPTGRLKVVISSSKAGTNLDDLYTGILSAAIQLLEDEDKDAYQTVMGRILTVRHPLSITALTGLRKEREKEDAVENITKHLGSLLSGVAKKDKPVRPIHTSFRDFLLDPKRSLEYYVDCSNQEALLASSAIQVMNSRLKFNISNFPSSYVRNSELPKEKMIATIPQDLGYSCEYWAEHLPKGPRNELLLELIQHFLVKHFLHWLEVLSLTGKLQCAALALSNLKLWMLDSQVLPNSTTINFIEDAKRFVRVFYKPISLSLPHIYISALPCAPEQSLIARHYSYITKIPQIMTGRLMSWPPNQAVLHGHSSSVNSVAFSSDGKRIVSGSDDKTIRIWDTESGEQVGKPLQGHSSKVNSVTFSPDGKRIASCSDDKTIQIWDTDSGEQVGRPLQGHSLRVNSVVFSPDGKRIASGSSDETIRIWDIKSGEQVGMPLWGHSSRVNSVAFSPDGKRIASGSYDETIRIWDIKSGEQVGKPLCGHFSRVNSVAFSPDGKRIASGSSDETIRIWDTQSGKQVCKPLQGHSSSVYSVAFSPDGMKIASGSDDETIQIWNTESGEQVERPLQGHSSWVNSVKFSLDGKRILSGSSDGTIQIWDTENGEQVGKPLLGHSKKVYSDTPSPDRKIITSCPDDKTVQIQDTESREQVCKPMWDHSSSVYSVAFSLDGKKIVSGSFNRTIQIWDTESGEQVCKPLQGHSKRVYSVAFSPDGKRIASGSSDKTIRIWDTESGEQVGKPLQGHSKRVKSVAFSPDGKIIASASDDKTIQIWDTESGEKVGKPLQGHSDWVNSVAFSPDGKRIASGSSDETIQIWDTESGEQVGSPLQGHSGWVNSVAFSPDGKRIASGSSDETIQIWDAESGEQVGKPLQGHSSPVYSVAFSPDGKRITSGSSDETIRIWDIEGGMQVGKALQGHTKRVNSVAFSPDGKRIASGSSDKSIRIWDTKSGDQVGKPLQGHFSRVNSVAFSPDGKKIASGSDDKIIQIWDIESRVQIGSPLQGHSSWVNSVAFSPGGKRIASGSDDKTIQIWNTENGEQIGKPLQGHSSSVKTVAFSPDGKKIASGSSDETIQIWDTESGKQIGKPLQGHSSSVNSVAFSPDGKRIASGSSDDSIQIWDTESGEQVGKALQGHSTRVYSVAFSPDGKRIASGSSDKTIQIWDIKSGEQVGKPLCGHFSRVNSVAFSPDGKRIASGSSDETIRIWDTESGEQVGKPLWGHSSSVYSVAFSPDGKRIASGSSDETIRIWDIESWEEVGKLLWGHSGEVNSLALSLDGRSIASGSSDQTIGILKTKIGEEVGGPVQLAPLNIKLPLTLWDGWILGPDNELILWLPHWNQTNVWWQDCILLVFGRNQTQINWSNASCGHNWIQCHA